MQIAVQLALQGGLILAQLKENKTFVLSLRSSALVFVLGMNGIVAFLGLFSLWQIFYFAYVVSMHFILFQGGLHETPKRDDRFYNPA